jgi:hypothetical protein
VRPGGMERPTDYFKETHNLVLAKETYFGGLFSNLQVNLNKLIHSMQVYNYIILCYVPFKSLFSLRNKRIHGSHGKE